jgi:MFS family permease
MEQVAQTPVNRKEDRRFILGSLSIGHGISHLYDLGFPLLLKNISDVMGFGTVQVAILLSIRQAGSGVINLGAGPLVDTFRGQWGLILTGCLVWSAVAFAFIGLSPNFAVIAIGVALVSIPGALWHLPAAAALSQRFADRRGFAMSIHGSVANVCNYLGPLMAGVLLTVLVWRHVMLLYTIPALVMAGFVWWSLKDLGKEGGPGQKKDLGAAYRDTFKLLKNPLVAGLILAAMLRGIGLSAVGNWTPFYLEDQLGMGHIRTGFYLGLLSGMGIISAPILGALSDKIGRKTILVPGFVVAAVLSMLVVASGDGFLLVLVFVGLGLFSFALHQIIQAAVLDVVGRGTEATAIGLLFGLNGVIAAASPFLARVIIDHFGGYGSIFYYSGILTALTAALVLFLPIPSGGSVEGTGQAQSQLDTPVGRP